MTKQLSREDARERLQELCSDHDLEVVVGLEIGGMKRRAAVYRHDDRTIRLSRHLLDNHPDELDRILLHELGHAVAMQRHGGDITPHGEEWQEAMHDLGVTDPQPRHDLQLAPYRYVVRCRNDECGSRIGRYRASKLVRHPERYRCGDCGSRLERADDCAAGS